MAGRLIISLLGALSVTDDAGRALTPKGAKNQAILALLALSPQMTRPRRWIEDKLWSTFGPEQSGANLRQALTKLRTALGEHADILIADRTGVSLDTARVEVDVLAPVLPVDTRAELLEGLDVRDPEFEDWLRMERAELAQRIAATRPMPAKGVLITCRPEKSGGEHALYAEILANQIGENIAEQVRSWRRSQQVTEGPDALESDVELSCDILEHDTGHSLFIKGVHSPSGRILYSKLHPLRDKQDILISAADVSTIVFEAADRIIGKLPMVLENARPEARATALSRLALYRMFSFEEDALHEAFGLLQQAYELDRNGVYLAWCSMVRMIQLVELLDNKDKAVWEEALALNAQAMEQGEDNALVQALVSKVIGTAANDSPGAFQLAEQAVERNPASGFAWKSLAEAHMLKGDPAAAMKTSARAREIARFSPFRQWWDMGHCVIAIACNDVEVAIEAGEAAARAAPSSRAAYRHLLALYATTGQTEKAMAAAEKLSQIEPGFSLDRIVNDDAYPVRTLRNKGLLEPLRDLL